MFTKVCNFKKNLKGFVQFYTKRFEFGPRAFSRPILLDLFRTFASQHASC